MQFMKVFKDAVSENYNSISQDNVKPEDSSGRRWRGAAIFMAGVDVILLVSILAMTITWRIERGQEPIDIKRESEMCLPCKHVYHHYDDVRDNSEGFKTITAEDKDMCCGHASRHLDQPVALYTEKVHQKERQLKMQITKHYNCNEDTQSTKPSAHLVGVTKSVLDMHHHHTLKWNDTCHLSNINGVVYNKGKLYVRTSGFYYIYSQIIYQDHRYSSLHTENDIGLHHSIRKAYNGDDITSEKLLESTQSQCQIVGNRSNQTSYIGAVVYLKENEHIYVKVSHPHKILLSQHANYVGMYLT